MNMTRAQLDALLRRNPQIRADETAPGLKLPLTQLQRAPLPSLDPPTQSQARELARPLVRITSARLRLLDPDNLPPSCKALVDGLVQAGLIPGDGPGDIETEYCQKKVKHRSQQATIVEIFYP